MKSTSINYSVAADHQNEENAAICIPAGLTLGMFIGLVVGELVFGSLGAGMFIGAAAGTMIGAVLMALCLRKRTHGVHAAPALETFSVSYKGDI